MHAPKAQLRIFLLLLLISSSGCTTRMISGDVYYRERIALPLDAKVIVSLEDISRADTPTTIISKREFIPATGVPIPFELTYKTADIIDNHRYALRAQIRAADNQLLWETLEDYLVLDDPQDKISLQLTQIDEAHIIGKVANDTRRLAFECEESLILATVNAREAILHIKGADLHLQPAPAASGARYTNNHAEFWSRDNGALISVDGISFSNCQNKSELLPWAEAKARGIDFRATGNEPDWTLELDADLQIEFVGNHGNYRVVTPVPVPSLDSAEKSTYHTVTETHDLLLTIETKLCVDSISGAQFPQQVRILLDGNAYHGCGKSL